MLTKDRSVDSEILLLFHVGTSFSWYFSWIELSPAVSLMFVHRFSPSGRFHLALWAAANEGQMCLGAKARGTRLSPLFSQTYGFP